MGLIAKYGKRHFKNKRVTLPNSPAFQFKLDPSIFLQRLPFCFLYSILTFPLTATSAQQSELSKITASFSPGSVTISRTTYAVTATHNQNRSIDYSFQPYDNSTPAIDFNISKHTSISGGLYLITSDSTDIKATASVDVRPKISAPVIRLHFNNNQTNSTIMPNQTITPASIFLNSSFVAENRTSINITHSLPSDGSKQKTESKKLFVVIVLTITLVVVLGFYYCYQVKEKSNISAGDLNNQDKRLGINLPPPEDCANGVELTLLRQYAAFEGSLTDSGAIRFTETNEKPIYRGSLTGSGAIRFAEESEQPTQPEADDHLVREDNTVTVTVVVHSPPDQQPDAETSTVKQQVPSQ